MKKTKDELQTCDVKLQRRPGSRPEDKELHSLEEILSSVQLKHSTVTRTVYSPQTAFYSPAEICKLILSRSSWSLLSQNRRWFLALFKGCALSCIPPTDGSSVKLLALIYRVRTHGIILYLFNCKDHPADELQHSVTRSSFT